VKKRAQKVNHIARRLKDLFVNQVKIYYFDSFYSEHPFEINVNSFIIPINKSNRMLTNKVQFSFIKMVKNIYLQCILIMKKYQYLIYYILLKKVQHTN